MVDCRHCIMNMEDEDEYVDFYDFSKTYENHPLMIQSGSSDSITEEEGEDDDEPVKASKKKKKAEGSDDDWDDCDLESIDSDEAAKEIQEE
jgi:hypothetical protein